MVNTPSVPPRRVTTRPSRLAPGLAAAAALMLGAAATARAAEAPEAEPLVVAIIAAADAAARQDEMAALPTPGAGTAASPGARCLAAIAAAERAEGIPPGLLRAIAIVESGRPDPESGGRLAPWPWSINAAGTGRAFATKQEAIAAVEALRAEGVRSIDVGCGQVNLLHHPNAFASLEDAFDPAANMAYAARFLRGLAASAGGSWARAAAGYHSQTPALGGVYALRVMAVWPDAWRHGPWPALAGAAPGAGLPGAPIPPSAIPARIDYSLYTPDFAARLRRMEQDRAARLGPQPVAARGGGAQAGRAAPPGPVWINRPPEPVPLRRNEARSGATARQG